MKYRRLGSTNLEVSVVGLGTWQYGGEWGVTYKPGEVKTIIGTARDEGINLIDTAECYGDHLSEELIGQAIQGERQNWIVATKFGHHYHDFQDRTMDFSPDGVKKQLETSLKALKTDYIDIYQFHSGKLEESRKQDLWEMLAKEKEKGKIRHIGISVSKGIAPEDKLAQAEEAPGCHVETIQIIYNRLDRLPEKDIFDVCRKNDLGVFARVPLASGLLSGKYRAGVVFPELDVRSRRDQEEIGLDLAEVEKIRANELPEGVNMAQWALAWCLRNPAVTCVIPGCKSPEQVRMNAGAVTLLDS
jgi:myo-inositol catabolism protein IolS